MAAPEGSGGPLGRESLDPENSNAPKFSSSPAYDNAQQASKHDANPAVRFASAVQEISPTLTGPTAQQPNPAQDPTPKPDVTNDQLRELSSSLQQTSNLQGRRLSLFGFEPYSLPASRIPSREDESAGSTRLPTPNRDSPRLNPSQHLQSPPLTPWGTDPADADAKKNVTRQYSGHGKAAAAPEASTITPQASTSHDNTPGHSTRHGLQPRSVSSEQVPRGSATPEDHDPGHRSHRRGIFELGSGSTPVSRESSPSRAAQFYSKPMTPEGEVDDPYAASKRQPQTRFPDRSNIESRFQFAKRKPGHGSPSSSSASLAKNDRQRHPSNMHSRQSSFADLKRFFKKGGHHKEKRAQSGDEAGTKTPPGSRAGQYRQPFGEDHGLTSKYGKLGKVLGSGAGGRVRLMKRNEDGVVFAVKEFRERYASEKPRDYVKRLTAEYCTGSTFHHGNIIETLDIVQEKDRWFQVMEYAPYDLFAIVMTGKMSRAEITCCFLQILSGVTYLHSMGVAHRDLKLDNVVVSDKGIMKIIDFGSAHVYKYSFESGVSLASGVVGSDPYLAPEVFQVKKYDAAAVDIWSLAIIYCCMSLRRFPWKVPKMTDNSFKLFAAEPTPGHDPKDLVLPSRSEGSLANMDADNGTRSEERTTSAPTSDAAPAQKDSRPPTSGPQDRKEIIRGPWRVLRVLPRESRHVIRRMLEIDPKNRATMEEILEDPWVADSDICQQFGPGGEIKSAAGHTHVLEYPQPQPSS